MAYLSWKATHVICVAASYFLFVLRGIWMMRDSALLRERWVRIVPHAFDTTLLVSAVMLAVMTRQAPFANGWLTAKVAGLVIYIGLGMMALKRAKSRRTRIAAWIAAQAVFFYIVAVALTRNPLPWAG